MIIYLCIRIFQYEYSLWNVSNHRNAFWLVGKITYIITYKKRRMKTFSKEQVTIVQRQRIIWWVQWHHWCRTFQPPRIKGRIVQEEWCQGVVSRPEEKFIIPSCSRWKHRGIQSKIHSMRLPIRHSLQRNIYS